MSRKPAEDDGSLDLLLDTICNTFGGVLFISMAVVLLLNMLPSNNQADLQSPPESAHAELIEWEERMAQTTAELEKLQTAIKQQTLVEQQLASPELLKQMQELRQSQTLSAELLAKKSEDLMDMAQSTRTAEEVARSTEQLKKQLQNSQQELEAMDRSLQQEINSRMRAAKLPRMRSSRKKENILFLKSGRLCSYSPTLHPDEFDEKQDEQSKYIEPKPGTGVRIAADRSRDLDRRLDEYASATERLTIFVWPDSFAEFAVLKEHLVAKGLEYSPQPFPESEKIRFGESQVERKVQ